MKKASEHDADMGRGAERGTAGKSESSRREFLGISAVGLAAAMIPQKALGNAVRASHTEVSDARAMTGSSAA